MIFWSSWQNAEDQPCATLFFSGKTCLRVLPDFFLCRAVPWEGIHSALHGQGVSFFPEMFDDSEQLREGLGVGVRAGVPDFSGRENPQLF